MNIYEQAIEAWGEDAQLGMLQEECAELIAAINKLRRGEPASVVIEEIADVELMLAQMRYIFPPPDIDRVKAEKIERLGSMLMDVQVTLLEEPP